MWGKEWVGGGRKMREKRGNGGSGDGGSMRRWGKVGGVGRVEVG